MNMPLQLIDTHTHFDDSRFDHDRLAQLKLAQNVGLKHIVISGIESSGFNKIIDTQNQLNNAPIPTQTHIALGLHPFFIKNHCATDLSTLENYIKKHKLIALGEIGLDTFTKEMKQPDVFNKQQDFFIAQLDLAVKYKLPVLLHIRKAHAQSLQILKKHEYNAHKLGGIAHSFSGGEQEAKAFINLGFKLGITGQITNPNAKKLRRVVCACVQQFGTSCLVIETDSPDMMPLNKQIMPISEQVRDDKQLTTSSISEANQLSQQINRNTPANLLHILTVLSQLINCDCETLAKQLWQNSTQALQVNWKYPS
ncbi:TatD family hydrolase [Psychrobacter sp. HD31]|uniref:TatD family hydrolase n=1 Tax=Psychrobacter sp. HD31 TaxID=3112003 RepID=UPI003DA4F66D